MSYRERLAKRLRDLAQPGASGDFERGLAHALEYGTNALWPDEAELRAAVEGRLKTDVATTGSNGLGPERDDQLAEPVPFAQPLTEFIADKRAAPEPLVGTSDDCLRTAAPPLRGRGSPRRSLGFERPLGHLTLGGYR
jgi:hypothetical protein